MTVFVEVMQLSGLDPRDFKVLVPGEQWSRFATMATGKLQDTQSITKVTLGKIDFIPAD
jgi:hypothetical protein